MDNGLIYIFLATTALLAAALISFVGLRAVSLWIDLKRAELHLNSAPSSAGASNRIELADLRERLRKLEAIAAGVDL